MPDIKHKPLYTRECRDQIYTLDALVYALRRHREVERLLGNSEMYAPALALARDALDAEIDRLLAKL